MATEPASELSFGDPAVLAADPRDRVAGLGPWRLALRRLRRNKVALAFGVLFVVIVGLSLAAPLWADHVAHTDPFQNHLTDRIVVDGVREGRRRARTACRSARRAQGEFFLGADGNGRDIAVRLLYGGPHVAAHRHRRGARDDLHVDHHRHDRGLLPRLGGHDHLAQPGHPLGLPAAAAAASRSARRWRSAA